MSARKTNAKAASKSTAKVSAKAKRAPGDSTALAAKAQDNLAKLHKQRGKVETITGVRNTQGGDYVMVEGSKGNHFLRSRKGDSKAFRAVTVMGALYEPAAKWNAENPVPKPQAKLAHGVDSHNSPHSAKAAADQRKGAAPAKAENKGKARTAKAASNKQPSKGVNRSYTKGSKKNEARPDTWRFYMLQTIMGAKDMDSAKAAHAKSGKFSNNKLDFTWADQQGYIKFAK